MAGKLFHTFCNAPRTHTAASQGPLRIIRCVGDRQAQSESLPALHHDNNGNNHNRREKQHDSNGQSEGPAGLLVEASASVSPDSDMPDASMDATKEARARIKCTQTMGHLKPAFNRSTNVHAAFPR